MFSRNRAIKKMERDIVRKFGLEDSHTVIFALLVEQKVDIHTLCEVHDEYMNISVMLDY